MRHLFLIVVLCLANFGLRAQEKVISGLQSQLDILELPESFVFKKDNAGFSKFKNPQFISANGSAIAFQINANNVHLVDVNADGLTDIIYQDMRHYAATIVFKNQGDNHFKELWSGSGRLLQIDMENDKSILYILNESIGCIFYNTLLSLIVNAKSDTIENILSYHFKTTIAGLTPEFSQGKLSGILRFSPRLDNTKRDDPCTNNLVTGNQITELSNENVIILKKQKDWLLVHYEKEVRNSVIGWIQKR